MMDQNQFMQQGRKLLKRIGVELNGANDLLQEILDDDTLNQEFIDDGGNMLFRRKPSELEALRTELAKCEAKRPELRLRKQAAQLGLKVSQVIAEGETMTITTVVKEGRDPYVDSEGKRHAAIPPKLNSTTVPVVVAPRVPVSLGGFKSNYAQEYSKFLQANFDYAENEKRISDIQGRIAQKERDLAKLKELLMNLKTLEEKNND